MELILASTSPYRKALLDRLHPCRSVDPRFDERPLQAVCRDPEVLVGRLAVAKAAAVAREFPHAAVVGGDQLVAFEGRVLGKPGSVDAAVEQLEAMSGRTHRLLTALAVIAPSGTFTHLDTALLTMRDLSDDEIERYVAADKPLDCAGAYKLESLGISLFQAIECADHTAIVGMPLIALTTILRELGFRIP